MAMLIESRPESNAANAT